MSEEKNLKDAAAYFGVSTRTIRRWITDGRLSARRLGRTTMVDVEKVPDAHFGGGEIQSLRNSDNPEEFMLSQHVERAETERDLAIRRMGHLEDAASRMPFWRSLAASSLLLCLVLGLGLAAGAAWVVQEFKIRSTAMTAETDRADGALAAHAKANVSWNQSEKSLKQQLADARAAVEAEQRERLRLAEELAQAVTQASAATVLEAQAASEAQLRIERLQKNLEMANQRIAEIEQAKPTVDLNELLSLIRQAVESKVAGDPLQLMGDEPEDFEEPSAVDSPIDANVEQP
jgi:excisionase family DNA binding protein